MNSFLYEHGYFESCSTAVCFIKRSIDTSKCCLCVNGVFLFVSGKQ